jgi:hypothetical protein
VLAGVTYILNAPFRNNDAGGVPHLAKTTRAVAIAAGLPYDEVYEALGKPDTTNGIPWKPDANGGQ